MLEPLLRHERTATLVLLALIVALSWAYLLTGAGTMQDMGGMSMPMTIWPWTAGHAVLMYVMWLVMMVAMMLPSAAPVILLYGTISRRRQGGKVARVLFALGYVAVWGGFSLSAVLAQFVLEWAGLLDPMMESGSAGLSGALLVMAGIYQFTPWKHACLRSCRSPLDFLVSHWNAGNAGAFGMGVRHGIYCVGCCWGLMLLLFVGGVMNLVWILGLAVYVLVEKLFPGGEWLSRAAGVSLMVAGAALLVAGPA